MRKAIKRRGWGKSELGLSTAPLRESPEEFERRIATMLRDFDKNDAQHPPSCTCPRCLYAIYDLSQKGPGRPWSENLFLIAWLIHEAKLEHLRGKVELGDWEGDVRPFAHTHIEELTHYCGVRLYFYKRKDYDKAPSWKRARGILARHQPDLIDLLPAYSQRVKRPEFRRVLAAITEEKLRVLRAEHEKLGPPLPGWEPDAALRLSMRIQDYIFSRPRKMATRRELQRKFRVSAAEVDTAVAWLEGHGIYLKQVAHKFQRKRGGYRNKRTFVFAARDRLKS